MLVPSVFPCAGKPSQFTFSGDCGHCKKDWQRSWYWKHKCMSNEKRCSQDVPPPHGPGFYFFFSWFCCLRNVALHLNIIVFGAVRECSSRLSASWWRLVPTYILLRFSSCCSKPIPRGSDAHLLVDATDWHWAVICALREEPRVLRNVVQVSWNKQ